MDLALIKISFKLSQTFKNLLHEMKKFCNFVIVESCENLNARLS
jgi:hypothetical protein